MLFEHKSSDLTHHLTEALREQLRVNAWGEVHPVDWSNLAQTLASKGHRVDRFFDKMRVDEFVVTPEIKDGTLVLVVLDWRDLN